MGPFFDLCSSVSLFFRLCSNLSVVLRGGLWAILGSPLIISVLLALAERLFFNLPGDVSFSLGGCTGGLYMAESPLEGSVGPRHTTLFFGFLESRRMQSGTSAEQFVFSGSYHRMWPSGHISLRGLENMDLEPGRGGVLKAGYKAGSQPSASPCSRLGLAPTASSYSQRAQNRRTKRKTPLWTIRPKGARVGKGRGSCELASPNAEEGPKGAKATIREKGPMASLRANPTTV